MWCSKCGAEYRDGFTVCSDCGAPLTALNPGTVTDSKPHVVLKHPCLLATGADVPDLELLLELLRKANIPAYLKDDLSMYNLPVNYQGCGLGHGVCVEESRLAEAQRLLADSIEGWEPDPPCSDEEAALVFEDADAGEENADTQDYLEGYIHREKKLTTWIACLFIGAPVGALLFLFLFLSK